MTTDTQVLHELFQTIPIYGYGSILDLEIVRVRFLEVAFPLTKHPDHVEFGEEMIEKINRIGEKIMMAINAEDERFREKNFDAASNELSMCVESVIRKFTKHNFTNAI